MKLVRWLRGYKIKDGRPDPTQPVYDEQIIPDEEAQNVHLNGGQVVADIAPAPVPRVSEEKREESRRAYGAAPAADLVSGPYVAPTRVIPLEGAASGRPPAPTLRELVGSEKAAELYAMEGGVVERDNGVDEMPVPTQREPQATAERFVGTAGRDIARAEAKRREEQKVVLRPELVEEYHERMAVPLAEYNGTAQRLEIELQRFRSVAEARVLLLTEAKRLVRVTVKNMINEEGIHKADKRLGKVVKILDSLISMDGEEDVDR
jgi:hypothetical protein